MSKFVERSLLLLALAAVAYGCTTTPTLRRTVNIPGVETKNVKPPLEYKSDENLPYTARLTYGEICVNSKRLGKEYCFPCYASANGGCDGAMQDLIDKAIVCSASIGPAIPQLPSYQGLAPLTYTPVVPQVTYQQPMITAPANTYPNFSR